MGMEQVQLKEILKITCHEYTTEGYSFRQLNLKTFFHPYTLFHLLAFDGVAVLNDGKKLICDEWDMSFNGKGDIMHQVKAALLTSYHSVITEKIRPTQTGCYILKSIEAEAWVDKNGLISIPDHKQLMKHAQKKLIFTFP